MLGVTVARVRSADLASGRSSERTLVRLATLRTRTSP
jgi:hypothetical protein